MSTVTPVFMDVNLVDKTPVRISLDHILSVNEDRNSTKNAVVTMSASDHVYVLEQTYAEFISTMDKLILHANRIGATK